jgi:hypothetical protein
MRFSARQMTWRWWVPLVLLALAIMVAVAKTTGAP